MSVDIVVMSDCASNYGVFVIPSSRPGGAPYRVELYGSEGPAYCPCPAFTYRQDCRHIKVVWHEDRGACLYNPQWRDGIATPGLKPVEFTTLPRDIQHDIQCPSCGGPTVFVRRAV